MADATKKFLWIAVAVTAFALVVIGAAFLFLAPGSKPGDAPFDLGSQTEAKPESPQDYLADAPSTSTSLASDKGGDSGDIIIVYGGSDATTVTTLVTRSPDKAVQPSPTSPAVSAPAPTTTTIVVTPPAPKPAPALQAPTPAAQAAASSDYWIQAGSFGVKANAEALRQKFEAKNLSSAIKVKDISGKSYYQVRVGPYPTRADASKWLPAVKSVDGASGAFITQ